MANHKSALKRYRQSEKRRVHNQQMKAECRTWIKKTRKAVREGNLTEAQSCFKTAEVKLSKAANKGVYPRKTASRYISRLAGAVNSAAA